MDNKKYNGWSNHATWCVSQWLNNDESSYGWLQKMIAQAIETPARSACWNTQEWMQFKLARILKENLMDQNPLADDNDLYADLLNSQLCDVDWFEIALNELEEMEEYWAAA